MRVLVPLWRRQRVTGQRLRQRIAGVMAWAVAAGYRQDDPTGTLSAVLPAGRKLLKHHRFLPAVALKEALAKVDGSRAWVGTRLALRFLALTAARSGEVRGARWAEVDLEAATWVVPASRMKSRREHRGWRSPVRLWRSWSGPVGSGDRSAWCSPVAGGR